MIIVAGFLRVDPEEREAYLDGCHEVVAAARASEGCLDFALSPDLLEADRINVYEQWEATDAIARFRGSGPPDDQLTQLREIRVTEFDATAT